MLVVVVLNRWVFRAVLNAAVDGMCLISQGREFQTEGAAWEKAVSKCFRLNM